MAQLLWMRYNVRKRAPWSRGFLTGLNKIIARNGLIMATSRNANPGGRAGFSRLGG
jgi:hypothetical protein